MTNANESECPQRRKRLEKKIEKKKKCIFIYKKDIQICVKKKLHYSFWNAKVISVLLFSC